MAKRISDTIFKLTRRAPLRLLTIITRRSPLQNRAQIAARFLRGSGLEIGALHNPLPVPSTAQVKYVDRMSTPDLRKHYPELRDLPLTEPDIVDNGELLLTVPKESQDFIIANHFLEHCENPIQTILTHVERLRAGGILFYAIPDKRFTAVDYRRASTPASHILRDYREGSGTSREEHYLDWAKVAMRSSEPERYAKKLMDKDYSIHFHVWTKPTFHNFIEKTRQEAHGRFDILHLSLNRDEIIAILRKQSG